VGVINALLDSKKPIVPICGDQENGVLMGLAKNKDPRRNRGHLSTMSAAALKVAIALLKGMRFPRGAYFVLRPPLTMQT